MHLGAGQNTTLTATSFTVIVTWPPRAGMDELDAVALVLSAPGSHRADTDLVFFNARHHPRGIATVNASATSGRTVVTIDLARCAPSDERVLVALSNDCGHLHRDAPVRVAIDSTGTSLVTSELVPVGTESAMVLLELYRRNGSWKVRAVGQGYDGGLAALVSDYGFQVDEADVDDAPVMPAPRSQRWEPGPFPLWGTRGPWCNQEVNGTEHRQADILLLLPPAADTEHGADLDTTAVLTPEPQHPLDRHAVSVEVDGHRVGYLPADIAPAYSPVLLDLTATGHIPTVPVHLWARSYDGYDEQLDGSYVIVRRHYTRVTIALAEPELIRPLNPPPPGRYGELPAGASVKVTGTDAHLATLTAVLGRKPVGLAYATLHRTEAMTARTSKPVVEVRIDGQAVGTLTPQMSTAYLPVVDHLAAAGTTTVARALLRGSPVSVAVSLHAERAHEVSAEWLREATA